MSSGFSWSKVLGEKSEPEAPVAVKPVIEPDPELGSDSAQAIAERLISEMAEPAPRPKVPEPAVAEEPVAGPSTGPASGTSLSPSPIVGTESAWTEPAESGHEEAGVIPAPEPSGGSAVFHVAGEQGDATQAGLDEILRMAHQRGASDIHLTVGLPPLIRHDGEIKPLPFRPLQPADTQALIHSALSRENLEKFEKTHELDFAYSVAGVSRFRFNAYVQRGSCAAALRTIASKIPSFETLGLPPVIRELTKRTSGLILVTGPTGSGKSTTIASIIDDINSTRTSHILTIEDPIEYLHEHKRCMVNQRELHADTFAFSAALRAVLREDPDIVLVGEMRDLETIEAALTLSETGHLVFGTLHTKNAPATIDRVIDVFPPYQQDQIRVLLGNTLESVIAQQLLPKLGGGRAAAIEVMLGTPAIKNLIREGKTHQMYSIIETSRNMGMQTMDSSLAEHYRSGACSYDECLMRSVDKESFARMAKGG